MQIRNHFPAVLSEATRASTAGQNSFMRWSAAGLMLACVAALGGALSIEVSVGGRQFDAGGVLAVLAFAGGVVVAFYLLGAAPQRMWYDGRATAESIKTLSWQYTVGGGPFRIDPGAEPDDLFVRRLSEIIGAMTSVPVGSLAGRAQITPEMRAVRDQPLPARRALYLTQRIHDQISWYGAKAAHNQSRVRRWFLIAIVTQAIGLVVGSLKAFSVVDVDLLGIVAAVAASSMAWLQTRDHQNLAASYAVTGRELQIINTRAEAGAGIGSEQRWADFVEDTELAISREHTLWLARRGSA